MVMRKETFLTQGYELSLDVLQCFGVCSKVNIK